jgi:hypothetical protein
MATRRALNLDHRRAGAGRDLTLSNLTYMPGSKTRIIACLARTS